MLKVSKEQLIEDYVNGKIHKETCREIYGVSRQRVHQILKPLGLKKIPHLKEFVCPNCGKKELIRPYLLMKKKFCSRECMKNSIKKYWENMKERKCTRCKIVKPVSEFYREKSGKIKIYCKKCHNEYVKDWQKRNPEKVAILVKKASQKYMETHREKIRIKNRKKYWENIEKSRERSKIYTRRRMERIKSDPIKLAEYRAKSRERYWKKKGTREDFRAERDRKVAEELDRLMKKYA